MRKLLLFAWLLMPVAALAYHYGPGQDLVRLDTAGDAAARAAKAAAAARELAAREGDDAARGLWAEAEAACAEALAGLPSDKVAEARALRLERAKAQMMISQLPEARRDLEGLVEEIARDPESDPALLADARRTLANAQFYMTWLMRLEGAPREEWQPEIDAARQTYKLLEQQAQGRGDADATRTAREDLEATIQLARAELDELQGLPLPSQ